ncbi:MAG TPA: LapA family protein [Gaiellaceae bacterium]|jgi:uncharacterized integral membrane protein|nr:LapA family protein [Gaiellaceae bacterium]
MDPSEREREFQRSWLPKLWLSIAGLILLAAYVIAFVSGNTDQASVNFIFFEARTSLIWVILLSLLAGLVAGVLIAQIYARRVYRSDASTETPSPIESTDS